MLSGSGLVTSSLQPHSADLSLVPDVDPACSRGAEGFVSQPPYDTGGDETRGGEADLPSPKDGEDDAERGEVVAVDSMKPGSS